jgi:glucose/arabinose dehydrogenase
MHIVARSLLLAAIVACGPAGGQTQAQGTGQAARSPTPDGTPGVVRAEVIARGLEHPWALALLPDGRFLVTERPGRLRIVSADGVLSEPLAGVPAVAANGQGGLLDVTLHPQFVDNRLVYISFAEPGEAGAASTAVARGRLGEAGLEDVQVIYRQVPKVQSRGHYGSRLVFDDAGRLFVTQGDRMNQRPLVQELSAGIGKIMRINPDGSVPDDNPFVGRAGALPEIWSYGHRNVQAAALHPETGQLWTVEHGARGGDELNHPEAGKNYGWPVITYGVDYSGDRIGEGTAKDGMEQPVYYWDPVIAPSGMVWYTGDAFPGWRGSVLIGSMTPGALVRLEMGDGRVIREERYLTELDARFRDVQQGDDGLVYVVTDAADGQLLRLRPVGGAE